MKFFAVIFTVFLAVSCTSSKDSTNKQSTSNADDSSNQKAASTQANEVCEVDHPEKNIYKICQDQQKIWDAVIGQSREKVVVATFGANWCDWCQSLHKLFNDQAFKDSLKGKFLFVDIGVYNGKKKVEPGLNILKSLLQVSTEEAYKKKVDGFPFIVVYNPQSGKSIEKNTGDLEKNTEESKGHDETKVKAFLEESYVKLTKKKK
jgi:thiol-disulfide isomerase/thioredoxin